MGKNQDVRNFTRGGGGGLMMLKPGGGGAGGPGYGIKELRLVQILLENAVRRPADGGTFVVVVK